MSDQMTPPTDGDRLMNEARTLVGDWNLGIARDARFLRAGPLRGDPS